MQEPGIRLQTVVVIAMAVFEMKVTGLLCIEPV